MSRMKPRKLVDLVDNKKPIIFDEDTSYVFLGKIWSWLRIGCIVCMAEDENDILFQTLESEGGECYCMTHRTLKKVPYKVRRAWEVEINGEIRTGVAEKETIMYIPNSYNEAEESELLEQIFSEYKALEEEFD